MAAGYLDVVGSRIVEARIAVGSCSPVALRLPALEAALEGRGRDLQPRAAGEAGAPGAAGADRRRARQRGLPRGSGAGGGAPPADGAGGMNEISAVPVSHDAVALTVNGAARAYRGDGLRRLADVLRDEFGLTGTKIGCNAGDCGACTVLLDGEQVCACLVPVGQCAGARDHHGRRAGRGGQAQRSAARVPRPRRRAVRHLHARHADGGERPVGASAPIRRAPRSRMHWAACCAAAPAIRRSSKRCSRSRRPAQIVRDGSVGASTAKVDGPAKLTGTERYGADAIPADALYLRVIRSPHASARFTRRRPRRVRRGPARPRARSDGARCADQPLWHLPHHQGPAGAGRWPGALSRRSGGRVRRHARRGRSHPRRGRADHL